MRRGRAFQHLPRCVSSFKTLCNGPALLPVSSALLEKLQEEGLKVRLHEPLGCAVTGWDLRKRPAEDTLQALTALCAIRGYIVFKNQGILTGDEQVAASEYFGGQELHSTHGVHPQAPNNHVFRLSNDDFHGIVGVGPQWHNDGSFVRQVFSHVGYHIVRVPESGGDTEFSHLTAAFDSMDCDTQQLWSRRVSVNATSGVVHPLVFEHPYLNRPAVYLHLGMTGAVIELAEGVTTAQSPEDLRCLDETEMTALFNEYNELLNNSSCRGRHAYEEGDMVLIDNLAVAHRAAPEAHMPVSQQGLRILHRTTVAGVVALDPPPQFRLPPTMDIFGENPLGSGVWCAGGVGFRWDPDIAMRN